MDNIKEIIMQLDQCESDWRMHIKTDDDSKVTDVETFRKNVLNLILALREILKRDNEQEIKEVYELIDDEILADNIFKNVNITLVYFNAMKPVRKLEEKNLSLCKEFLEDVMKYYVVRLDKKLLDKLLCGKYIYTAKYY